jgi:hypothetical protein
MWRTCRVKLCSPDLPRWPGQQQPNGAMHYGSDSHSVLRKIDFHLAQILAARSVLGLGFDFVLEVQLYAEG